MRLRIALGYLAWLGGLLLGGMLLAGGTDAVVAAERTTLEVFVRDGCPQCRDAKLYLDTLSGKRADVDIVYRHVDTDVTARTDLERWTRAAG